MTATRDPGRPLGDAGRLALTAFALAAWTGAPVAAQRPYDAAEGFLVRPATSLETARTRCLTDLMPSLVAADDLISCRVTEFVTMDTADASWWAAARYRRRALDRGVGVSDTVDLDEVVLLAISPHQGVARPIWHTIRDRSIELIDGIRWARRRAGLLVAVEVCLNGTGGCYDQMLVEYGGDHWAGVADDFVQDLARRAPAGFSLHKGRRLDLETLTGEQPIATRDDPNCCPSGMMRFTVWLDGRHLRLVKAEVTKPDSG